MLASCIARSKKQRKGDDELPDATKSQSSIKSLTSQFKDMALKASGSYRQCHDSCTSANPQVMLQPQSNSDRFRWSLRRSGSLNSSSSRQWGKEMEARLKGISSVGSIQRSFSSGRRLESPVVFVPENEPKEWVAQVEPGILIDFISLPKGGNDLKRIRFSREMYNKLQAQKWWIENCDRVAELYNVQKLNQRTFPMSTPPRSADEGVKIESIDCNPTAYYKETTRGIHISNGMGLGSSPESFEHHFSQSSHHQGSTGLTSTPKLSSISGTKTETSSVDMSLRTSSSRDADHSDEVSLSNASDLETEWVEEDEPGVYITIRALSNGTRELRRVRFSREKFGEMHAKMWWEKNRGRIHAQYLS
ncbi:unnamed protein product [Rhodiola kirilowii]